MHTHSYALYSNRSLIRTVHTLIHTHSHMACVRSPFHTHSLCRIPSHSSSTHALTSIPLHIPHARSQPHSVTPMAAHPSSHSHSLTPVAAHPSSHSHSLTPMAAHPSSHTHSLTPATHPSSHSHLLTHHSPVPIWLPGKLLMGISNIGVLFGASIGMFVIIGDVAPATMISLFALDWVSAMTVKIVIFLIVSHCQPP